MWNGLNQFCYSQGNVTELNLIHILMMEWGDLQKQNVGSKNNSKKHGLFCDQMTTADLSLMSEQIV